MAEKAMIEKVRASVADVRKTGATVKNIFDSKIAIWKSVGPGMKVSISIDRAACESTSALLGICDDVFGTMLESLDLLYAETEQAKVLAEKVVEFTHFCENARWWELAILIIRVRLGALKDKKAAK